MGFLKNYIIVYVLVCSNASVCMCVCGVSFIRYCNFVSGFVLFFPSCLDCDLCGEWPIVFVDSTGRCPRLVLNC